MKPYNSITWPRSIAVAGIVLIVLCSAALGTVRWAKMTTLSLRISIVKSNNVKMMQFDENVVVYDAMRIIRERVPDAAQGQGRV